MSYLQGRPLYVRLKRLVLEARGVSLCVNLNGRLNAGARGDLITRLNVTLLSPNSVRRVQLCAESCGVNNEKCDRAFLDMTSEN
jgi:hypothetical protein